MGRQLYTDDQFADVLTRCKGMLFVASRTLRCDHKTMLTRVKKSPRLQAIVAEQIGQVVDTAELKLFDAMESGDLGAIKFLLGTKGRDRGYGEEVKHKHGGDPDNASPILVTSLTVVPALTEGDHGRATGE